MNKINDINLILQNVMTKINLTVFLLSILAFAAREAFNRDGAFFFLSFFFFSGVNFVIEKAMRIPITQAFVYIPRTITNPIESVHRPKQRYQAPRVH